MILSISPGTHVTPSMSETIDKYVNMYRVTADDWDTWSDVASHFNVSRLSQLSSILYALFNYTMLNPTAGSFYHKSQLKFPYAASVMAFKKKSFHMPPEFQSWFCDPLHKKNKK